MSKLLPVSIIDYLNALPLNLAFKEGKYCDGLVFHYDFPSQCADNLAAKGVEAGLISTVEYQRIPNLFVASSVCIASKRRVRSVVIVTRKDFSDIKTLAVDRFSRSSVALARILFAVKNGNQPRLVTMAPDIPKMLKIADAALVIGDAALSQEGHGFQTLDLAQLWFELTGLPFVFAFWAMSSRAVEFGLAERFRAAKTYGLNQIQGRWQELSERFKMPQEDMESYLTHNIHYDLGEEERASLDRFYAYCFQFGLIPEQKSVRFV